MDFSRITDIVKESAFGANWPEPVVSSLEVVLKDGNLQATSALEFFNLEYGDEKTEPKAALRNSQPKVEESVSDMVSDKFLQDVEKLLIGKSWSTL